MSDPPTKGAQWGAGRVAFLGNRDAMQMKVDQGHSLKSIYAEFKPRLGISYPQFTRYVTQFLRPKDQPNGHQNQDASGDDEPGLPLITNDADDRDRGAAEGKPEHIDQSTGEAAEHLPTHPRREPTGKRAASRSGPPAAGERDSGDRGASGKRAGFQYDPTKKRSDLF